MEEVIGWTLVVVLVIGDIYLLWPDRYPHEADATAEELQEAQAEIVRLDGVNHGLQLRIDELTRERAEFEEDNYELTQSIEHTLDRLRSSEEIRLKLAASLSGRCCGGQITMGNTESNRKAEELFECPYIGEMIGERFDILMPERKRGIHGPHWEQFWLAPVPRMMTTMPLDCRKRDGSEFKAQILLAPCKSGIRVSCLVQFVPQ